LKLLGAYKILPPFSLHHWQTIGVNLRKKPEFSKKRKEGCRERKKLK
jgi:hypothetical protein